MYQAHPRQSPHFPKFGDVSQWMDWSPVSAHVSQHLRKVFSSLLALCVCSCLGVSLHLRTHLGGLLTMFGAIGLVIGVQVTRAEGTSNKRLAMFLGFGLLEGMSLGPLIDAVLAMEDGATTVLTAFVGASIVFACLAAAAALSPRRSMLWLAGFLSLGLSMLALMGLANLFIRSPALTNMYLYGGLALFCVFVLFDTQMIIERFNAGDNDFLSHSISLFLDLIQIFVRLLIILAKKKKEEKK